MSSHDSEMTIRILDRSADAAAVRRLAQLDSTPAPTHPLLGAEQNGRLIAAVSLAGAEGAAIADPFRPTATAIELLRLRAAQLRAGLSGESPRRLRRLIGRSHRAAPRAVLATKGAGASLLQPRH